MADELMRRLLEGEQTRQRGTFLPIETTTWGNVRPAVPAVVAEPYAAAARFMTGQHAQPGADPQAAVADALSAAGGAMGGTAFATRPAGAVASGLARPKQHGDFLAALLGDAAPQRAVQVGQPDAPTGVQAYHWSPNAAQIGPGNKFRPGSHFGTQKAARDRMQDVRDEPAPPSEAGATIPVRMDINNPLYVADNNLDTPSRIAAEMEKVLGAPGLTRLTADAEWKALQGEGNMADVYAALDDVLRKQGYDGLAYKNQVEDPGSVSYIATRPGTVRSATTGETLFSDPLMAALLAGQDEER